MGVIVAEALTRVFRMGDHEIVPVREVDLEIASGQVVFVVGPSGSGKSTLLNLFGALDRATRGTVHVGGRDLARLSNRQAAHYRRAEVGFIFQAANLLAPLTALANVAVPLLPDTGRAAALAQATEALQAVGLGERLHHRPSQLSGGEQQRVAIARALVRRPALLLADEPTGSLDSETGAGVMERLRTLVDERDMTAVIVTHTRDWIQDGDRVLEMRDGRCSELAA